MIMSFHSEDDHSPKDLYELFDRSRQEVPVKLPADNPIKIKSKMQSMERQADGDKTAPANITSTPDKKLISRSMLMLQKSAQSKQTK